MYTCEHVELQECLVRNVHRKMAIGLHDVNREYHIQENKLAADRH